MIGKLNGWSKTIHIQGKSFEITGRIFEDDKAVINISFEQYQIVDERIIIQEILIFKITKV